MAGIGLTLTLTKPLFRLSPALSIVFNVRASISASSSEPGEWKFRGAFCSKDVCSETSLKATGQPLVAGYGHFSMLVTSVHEYACNKRLVVALLPGDILLYILQKSNS